MGYKKKIKTTKGRRGHDVCEWQEEMWGVGETEMGSAGGEMMEILGIYYEIIKEYIKDTLTQAWWYVATVSMRDITIGWHSSKNIYYRNFDPCFY